jgi:hypothetical protein
MIEHFSKWLELMLLLDCNNKGGAYVFLDNVFNRFDVLVKILINQGMKFCGDLQELCERH